MSIVSLTVIGVRKHLNSDTVSVRWTGLTPNHCPLNRTVVIKSKLKETKYDLMPTVNHGYVYGKYTPLER